MPAVSLDTGTWSLLLTGVAGIMLILAGTLALLLQRIVQQDGRTEVQLPFGVRLSTNYPVLVLALIGAFLAAMPFYLMHSQPKGTAATRIAIAGQVAADRGDTRGDLFLGITDKIIPVGDIGQEEREVHLDALILPETESYLVVGIAHWDDGRQDVGYAPITRERAQSTPAFRMRIRRRQ